MMCDPIDLNDKSMRTLKETLDEMSDILDLISDNASRQIQIEWIGNKTYLVQGQALDAARHTLSSIWGCSRHECFSDAFTLARKFRDDLVQYLFIISTLDETKGLSEEDRIYLLFSRKKEPHEKAADSWLENTLSDDDHSKVRKNYFQASKYIPNFRDNTTVIQNCYNSYLKPLWFTIDRELNNYVHTNGSNYIMSNLPNYAYDHKKDIISQLITTIRGIMAIFVSFIILIKPSSIQSSDDADYRDAEQTPPEGCQYWVSPIIQNFIDTDIVRLSPDLKQFLKHNNKYGMQIE